MSPAPDTQPPAVLPPNAPPSDAALLDLEEKRLKCEKLRAEIEREKLPWWKQAGYLSNLTPITLAIVGLLSAWGTGFFDRQRETLKAESKALEVQKDALESQAKGLQADIADLKNSRNSLEDQVKAATAMRDKLEGENKIIRRHLDDAFVRVKGGASSAIYAIGHVTASKKPSKEEWDRLGKAVMGLPKEDSEPLRRLVEDMRLAYDLIPFATKELNEMLVQLDATPVSAWAKNVKLQIGPDNQLLHPDGTPYRSDDPNPELHDKKRATK